MNLRQRIFRSLIGVLGLMILFGCGGTSPASPPVAPTSPSVAPTADVAAIQTQAAQSVFATLTASVPTATATPVATETPTCDVSTFLKESENALSKFKDTVVIAQQTPRMSLAPMLSQLQDQRRAYSQIEVPSCALSLQQAILAAMDAHNDALLKFLGQAADSVVQQGMQKADEATKTAENLIADYKAGKITAFITRTPGPTLTPSVTPTPEKVIELGEWTWYPSASGNYINVDGSIKNISDHEISSVHIFFELRDANDKLLANESTYTDLPSIGPNQSSTFKLFAERPPGLYVVKIVNVTWR